MKLVTLKVIDLLFHQPIQRLCEERNIQNIFDAIILDEAQDYTPEEIDIFYRLCSRLFCVADERQKIYQGDEIYRANKTIHR